MPKKYVGIDFSGNRRMWGPRIQASNVWLATVEPDGELMKLASLQKVQELPGAGRPFARLAAVLANGDYLGPIPKLNQILTLYVEEVDTDVHCSLYGGEHAMQLVRSVCTDARENVAAVGVSVA